MRATRTLVCRRRHFTPYRPCVSNGLSCKHFPLAPSRPAVLLSTLVVATKTFLFLGILWQFLWRNFQCQLICELSPSHRVLALGAEKKKTQSSASVSLTDRSSAPCAETISNARSR